jgi:streptogramin lyase
MSPPGQTGTFAGSTGVAGFADGAGTLARFNTPRGLATAPDGSILVADSSNHIIRRIDVDGNVTTIAGEPGVPGSNDGPARQAHLNQPSGIDVNARGEIFISDTGNHTIRKLTAEGMVITIAGAPGAAGFADGLSGESRLSGPVGIRVTPDGSIFVADTSNNVIRKLVEVPIASHRHIGPV